MTNKVLKHIREEALRFISRKEIRQTGDTISKRGNKRMNYKPDDDYEDGRGRR